MKVDINMTRFSTKCCLNTKIFYDFGVTVCNSCFQLQGPQEMIQMGVDACIYYKREASSTVFFVVAVLLGVTTVPQQASKS